MARTPEKDVARTETIYVRMTAAEKEKVRKAAERVDMSISDFVRKAILTYAQPVAVYSGGDFHELAETAAGTATYMAKRLEPDTPFQFVPMVPMEELKEE